MLVVILALVAAGVAGGGAVCQQRAAAQAPLQLSLRLRLLLALLRRPLWLAGVLSDVVAFGFQTAALAHGSLVVVQPLLATYLLFALAFGAAWSRQSLRRAEWICALMVTGGLAAFLVAASPTGGVGRASESDWLRCVGWIVVAVALSLLGASRLSGHVRTALLAVAAGIGIAFMAVMAKALSDSLSKGVAHTFVSWPPYAVVVAGITSLLLIQSAYQSGPPTISLPIIAVVDPLVSSIIGVTLFREHVGLAGHGGLAAALAIAISAVGIIGLGHSEEVANQVVGVKAA
jgi:drug/metabolite transporter (DMT)-like permease